ncbi:hypothetical protein M0805_002767 [Coniferiporia weirii]|nr:hypothetical protein M0805_002767 [Coniferiporia weirii]
MSFDKAILRKYAQQRDPPSALPPDILLTHTEHTLTIFDAFPKAHFHFLVLPRVPQAAPGIRVEHLTSLRTLLASEGSGKGKGKGKEKENMVVTLLRHMRDDAASVRALVEAEMRERYGFVWGVNVGFHAVPSMDHIHLHVISSDLCAPALKTKKHYNSFHPKLGFFLHIDDVLSWFGADDDEDDGTNADTDTGTDVTESKPKSKSKLHPQQSPQTRLKSASSYDQKLKDPLECLHCPQTLKNIPQLKTHLQEHFDRLAKEELKARADSKKLKRKRDAPQPDSKSDSDSDGSDKPEENGQKRGREGNASNSANPSDSKESRLPLTRPHEPPRQSESRQSDDSEHTQKKQKQQSGSP